MWAPVHVPLLLSQTHVAVADASQIQLLWHHLLLEEVQLMLHRCIQTPVRAPLASCC
jgi:hypothetical protein